MAHILKFITTVPDKTNSVVINYVSEDTNLMIIDEFEAGSSRSKPIRRAYVVEPLTMSRPALLEMLKPRILSVGSISYDNLRDVPHLVALLLTKELT